MFELSTADALEAAIDAVVFGLPMPNPLVSDTSLAQPIARMSSVADRLFYRLGGIVRHIADELPDAEDAEFHARCIDRRRQLDILLCDTRSFFDDVLHLSSALLPGVNFTAHEIKEIATTWCTGLPSEIGRLKIAIQDLSSKGAAQTEIDQVTASAQRVKGLFAAWRLLNRSGIVAAEPPSSIDDQLPRSPDMLHEQGKLTLGNMLPSHGDDALNQRIAVKITPTRYKGLHRFQTVYQLRSMGAAARCVIELGAAIPVSRSLRIQSVPLAELRKVKGLLNELLAQTSYIRSVIRKGAGTTEVSLRAQLSSWTNLLDLSEPKLKEQAATLEQFVALFTALKDFGDTTDMVRSLSHWSTRVDEIAMPKHRNPLTNGQPIQAYVRMRKLQNLFLTAGVIADVGRPKPAECFQTAI